MTDALALVSSLSPSHLNPKFHLCPSHVIMAYSKVASCLLLSECKGSPSTKCETPTTAREEGPNLGSDLGQPSHNCWWGLPLGLWGTWDRCCSDNWSNCWPTWEAWGGSAPKLWESYGGSGTSPHYPKISTYLSSASWMPQPLILDSTSETGQESGSSESSKKWIQWGLLHSLRLPRHELKLHTVGCLHGPGSYDQVILNVTSHF